MKTVYTLKVQRNWPSVEIILNTNGTAYQQGNRFFLLTISAIS